MTRILTHVCQFAFLLILFVPLAAFARVTEILPAGAAALLKYEQFYVNRSLDENKVEALQNSQSAEFAPEQGNIFTVKSYWIDAEEFFQFTVPRELERSGLKLRRKYLGKEQLLLMVHPESEAFYSKFIRAREQGPEFSASATASSRTLIMWPTDNPERVFFGKLSLDREIGGVVRTIPRGEVARSLGVTMILQAAGAELPEDFVFLPEFYGLMPKAMRRGGMILRSLPPAYLNSSKRLMPLFALYTSPNKNTLAPIQKMIRESGLLGRNFVLEHIIRPFAGQWLSLAIESGITVEAHAQNILVEVDRRERLTGTFVYRDFGGFNIDLTFRREHKLAMPKELPLIEGEGKDYHQKSHREALRASLENYFEGGFLYGLGEALTRFGYKNVTYKDLVKVMRQEVVIQAGARDLKVTRNAFYETLVDAVFSARSNALDRSNACTRFLLHN